MGKGASAKEGRVQYQRNTEAGQIEPWLSNEVSNNHITLYYINFKLYI